MKKHFAVVGGVHGNELVGMEGAACIADFFGARGEDKSSPTSKSLPGNNTKPGVCHPGVLTLGVRSRRLRDAILRAADVTVMPCVNTVGFMSGTRCSPRRRTSVLRGGAKVSE